MAFHLPGKKMKKCGSNNKALTLGHRDPVCQTGSSLKVGRTESGGALTGMWLVVVSCVHRGTQWSFLQYTHVYIGD